MKTILLLLLATSSLFAQKLKDTLVDMKYYKVLYSQELRNPLEVTFQVYKSHHSSDRKGMTFKGYKGVVTSTNKDYVGNDYDKGHMASAESFSYSKESLESTFSYINSGLQYFELNRGVWKSLEEYERLLSQTDTVYVVCGAIFPESNITKLPSGASIPTIFYKTLTQKKETKYYIFPNKECTGHYMQYQVSKEQFLNIKHK